MTTKAEALAQWAIRNAKLQAIPWAPPLVVPAAPSIAAGVGWTTNTADLPSQQANVAFGQVRKRQVALAAKLVSDASPPLDLQSFAYQDVECDDVALALRIFGNSNAQVAPVVRNLLVERVSNINGRFGTSGMGVFMTSAVQILGARLRGLKYRGVAPNTDPNNAPACVAFGGKTGFAGGSDIVIEDFDFRDLLSSVGGAYPQGDGVVIEGTYSNVSIRKGYIENMPDGGLDIKSPGTRVDDVHVVNCHQSAKYWIEGHSGAIYSQDPRGVHVRLMGAPGKFDLDHPLIIDHIDFRSSIARDFFRAENYPVRVIVKSWRADGAAPGSKLFSKENEATGTIIDWGLQGPPGNGIMV